MFKRFIVITLSAVLLFASLMVSTSVRAAAPGKLKEASSPSECGGTIYRGKKKEATSPLAVNCIFLEEPIGGKPGYDLYVISCENNKDEKYTECKYALWRGEAITGGKTGPIQAILSYKPGDTQHGSLGLLYSYVGLIYKYLSGVIIGVVVLMTVVGGVEITISGGDPGKRDAGRDRIMHALMGMALWFLASLILYTINPTFFRF